MKGVFYAMLIIIGKTASGKTTVVEELCKKGYKRLTTYTTRPRRKNEPKDAYHFISEEEFQQKKDDGFFAEWDSYDTESGTWYYGSAADDYEQSDEKTVVILNPTGLRIVQKNGILDDNSKAIYIYANIEAIRKRLEERGDDDKEIERRILADTFDFRGAEILVDQIIYNGLDQEMPDVVRRVIKFYEGGGA